jgi:proton-translocating NADH-quinone oxidoreductase chain L
MIAGLLGRRIGSKGAGIITTGSIVISALLAWIIFYEVAINGSPTYLFLYNWIDIGYFNVNFGLLFDTLTATMLIVITSISALVHLYSTEYMSTDPHLPRFMSYLSLFTFFMLILVTADNFLQLFIGWEGVGLCSYLLINFWFTRIQANKSAIKAMVVNRIGDVGFAIAIFITYYLFNTIEFQPIFSSIENYRDSVINFCGFDLHALTVLSVFLLIAAVGKSAQIGLHVWLPDAMEGPTPVSALIHAATMVTAGVFLLIRTSYILEYAPTALMVIVIVGTITAFFAATVGIVQNDLKKVIAYSTCSQLGYMVFACGISNYTASIFHLMNHAFFKALLFLSAGCVIHAMADEQDFRKMGGIISKLPFTYSMMLIGSLSLMGFPFLTGFYSKDAILELAYSKYTFESTFSFWLGSISAFFTAFYSLRLIYLTFIANINSNYKTFSMAHESPLAMSLPLFILSIGSIYIGYIFRDAFIGAGSAFFSNSIFIRDIHNNLIEAEFLDSYIKLTPVILSLLGALIAFLAFNYYSSFLLNLKLKFIKVYTFFNNTWHFDFVYNKFIVVPVIDWGYYVSYKLLDRGLIERIGPAGASNLVLNLSYLVSRFQSGILYQYAFTIFFSTTIFIAIVQYPQFINLELLFILPVFILFLFA